MKMNSKSSLFVDAGLVVLLALLLTVVNQGFIRKHGIVKANNSVAAAAQRSDLTPKEEPTGGAALMVPVSFRPLNFALLRGGFTSVDEFFERVNEDPILHSFYGDCADRNASMHPLREDVMVFTAFRRGNQIKWAEKPLLVRKGEYVMTFCGKTVLARCGNLTSMASMQPSEDISPALLEEPIDFIAPPLSYAEAAPDAAIMASAGTSAAIAPASAAVHASRFFFIPPFYIPSGGSDSSAPPFVAPVSHITGDEFSGHQAFLTLFLGLFVIGLVKLVTR
jgi:hypothetical protein